MMPPRGQAGRNSAAKPADAPARGDLSVAFVDSSAIVALVDAGDISHNAAAEAYHSLVGSGYRLFTTNHVIVETFALLNAGLGPEIARQWLRDMRLAVYTADAEDEAKAYRMVLDAEQAQPVTLTDAISYVVMERLGVVDAFAVDPDFLAALS
jgi:predicted nucleic acid-binding protein